MSRSKKGAFSEDNPKKTRKKLKKKKEPSKEYPKEDQELKDTKLTFLYYYAKKDSNITTALRKASVANASILYKWLRDDSDFNKKYEEIKRSKETGEDILLIDPEKEPKGKREIQELKKLQEELLDAYRFSNFNLTEACLQLGVKRSTVAVWLKTDPFFRNGMEEVQEEKKDLVEEMLLSKVAQGDISAILYASKCLLKDRGYIENAPVKVELEVKRSKEERDAIIEAALVSQNDILDTPGGRLLTEKITKVKESEIIDGEIG